jgi:hypothetical protein
VLQDYNLMSWLKGQEFEIENDARGRYESFEVRGIIKLIERTDR